MTKRSRLLGFTALAALLACIGACAALGLAVQFAPRLYTLSERLYSLHVGAEAPDFALTSLDGQAIRLSQFRGHPVLLTFAASWCPGCRSEAPRLQRLHETHPELALLLVDSRESDAIARTFASDFGMTHPVLPDTSGKVSNQYHIYAIPTSFFIDADGIIRGMIIEEITPSVLSQDLPLIGVQP